MTRLIVIATATLALLPLTSCQQESNQNNNLTSYQCDSGKNIKVSYYNGKTSEATFQYQGKEQKLLISKAASGAKYSNEQFIWWTKGSGSNSEGTLFKNSSSTMGDESEAGPVLERCQQI